MPSGTLRERPLRLEEQYHFVDDSKLQLSLAMLTNRYSEKVRLYIYNCYNDPHLLEIYRKIRMSGVNDRGNAGRARRDGGVAYRRKIFEVPNPYVYDFIDTVLTQLYGKDWLKSNTAIKHELLRPWWVVNRL